jgi:enamine deaminase RidA (YjgF/YER057c/UK114 family)
VALAIQRDGRGALNECKDCSVHVEDRLRELGIVLPNAPAPLADYELAVRSNGWLFLAGHAPLRNGEHRFVGKVGREFDLAQGREAARLTALNMIATMKANLGDLDRVVRVVKLFGMVNCTEMFDRLPDVIDGASEVFVALWGDAGRHTRSAVGMAQLHYGMAIEIEGLIEIRD